MSEYFTHTVWHVRPGQEVEFLRRWRDIADWSRVEGLVGQAQLLRDTDDPTTFISFGRWGDIAEIRSWRTNPGYHERVAKLQELVESFEPRTLEVML